ncbi:hypothetical protein QYE76_019503 [Lolium multiflorum]|uniref:Uncharacterized protein n=1 Tax=Lolium multiflorum TaxID=4521 RepID=A0AAD8VQG9_LOLMU|nr:hypothetical protein QYE76_019503 [Lolium multiflorum]
MLEHTFSQQSITRGTTLRRQLGDCKKLDSSAHEYFNKVKTLTDTLTSIGQPLHAEEQVAIADNYSGYTTSYSVDPTWYFDTGATDHMTSEMAKLNSQGPYRGHGKVCTADGSGTGRGSRLEVLDAPVDVHVDRCMAHATTPRPVAPPLPLWATALTPRRASGRYHATALASAYGWAAAYVASAWVAARLPTSCWAGAAQRVAQRVAYALRPSWATFAWATVCVARAFCHVA